MTSPSLNSQSSGDMASPGASQTDWSMIHAAALGDGSAAIALDQLARRYWPAIYAFVRGTGRDVHQASDLTQGFVCDVVLGRGLLEVADPNRGRFRTLLLTALKNYMAERHRADTRQKRAPVDARVLEIDEHGGSGLVPFTAETPEGAYMAHWSAMLIQRVLDHVRQGCEEEGLHRHWAIFEARVVRPMLQGEAPTEYAALVDRFDLRDSAQAANMMITVKRRFARALYAEVGQTVQDPLEIDDELHILMRSLERPS